MDSGRRLTSPAAPARSHFPLRPGELPRGATGVHGTTIARPRTRLATRSSHAVATWSSGPRRSSTSSTTPPHPCRFRHPRASRSGWRTARSWPTCSTRVSRWTTPSGRPPPGW